MTNPKMPASIEEMMTGIKEMSLDGNWGARFVTEMHPIVVRMCMDYVRRAKQIKNLDELTDLRVSFVSGFGKSTGMLLAQVLMQLTEGDKTAAIDLSTNVIEKIAMDTIYCISTCTSVKGPIPNG